MSWLNQNNIQSNNKTKGSFLLVQMARNSVFKKFLVVHLKFRRFEYFEKFRRDEQSAFFRRDE